MSGNAADRRSKPHEIWEEFRRVVGSDLENAGWLEETLQSTMPEKAILEAKRQMKEAMTAAAAQIAGIAKSEQEAWTKRAEPEVETREGKEQQRERMRLILIAWRERTDGICAGEATFDQKWNTGTGFKLARRLVFKT